MLLLISSHPNELFLQRGTADYSLFSLLFISLFYYHFLNVSLFSVLELPESVPFIVKSFAGLKIFFLPQRKEVLPDFFFPLKKKFFLIFFCIALKALGAF